MVKDPVASAIASPFYWHATRVCPPYPFDIYCGMAGLCRRSCIGMSPVAFCNWPRHGCSWNITAAGCIDEVDPGGRQSCLYSSCRRGLGRPRQDCIVVIGLLLELALVCQRHLCRRQHVPDFRSCILVRPILTNTSFIRRYV